MGSERRRDPRIRCSIPCELRIAGRSLAGKVSNVSANGLGVVAEAPEAEQGEEVGVTLRVAGLAVIEVRALVWHIRKVSRRAGEKEARSFGLVLSDTAPEFVRLVERLARKQSPRTVPPCPPAAAPPAPTRVQAEAAAVSPEPPAACQYRIRIKQSGGSRTCRIVASGVSPDSAARAALDEVGPGWIVLDVAAIS